MLVYLYVITQKGGSALMYAANWGRTEAITQLVKAGANLDLQDKVCHIIEEI